VGLARNVVEFVVWRAVMRDDLMSFFLRLNWRDVRGWRFHNSLFSGTWYISSRGEGLHCNFAVSDESRVRPHYYFGDTGYHL
jgi:hypothetical protein